MNLACSLNLTDLIRYMVTAALVCWLWSVGQIHAAQDQTQNQAQTPPPSDKAPSEIDGQLKAASQPDQASAAGDEPAKLAGSLQELKEVQSKLQAILPQVLPCVVAVEGGSGVIVSENGLILTASHVAGRSGRILNVTLSDGRVVQATTLGTNNSTDAAALKINEFGSWPHVKLKNSTSIKTKQWCFALGYPSGYPRHTPASLRLGQILKIEPQELTTDCLLMGGDSGGPLFNLDGELIGIHSRVKNKPTENFHIPQSVFLSHWQNITSATDIRTQASPTGRRAYLGLNAETDNERVRIRKVHPGSPAEAAGLQAEDVILQFDKKTVTDFDQILQSLEGRQPGDRIMLIVNRYGRLVRKFLLIDKQY